MSWGVHSAGRLDAGSDVLGFATPRSMDYDWGPKASLFLAEAEYTPERADHICRVLGEEVPFVGRGFPTHVEYGGSTGLMRHTDVRSIRR